MVREDNVELGPNVVENGPGVVMSGPRVVVIGPRDVILAVVSGPSVVVVVAAGPPSQPALSYNQRQSSQPALQSLREETNIIYVYVGMCVRVYLCMHVCRLCVCVYMNVGGMKVGRQVGIQAGR